MYGLIGSCVQASSPYLMCLQSIRTSGMVTPFRSTTVLYAHATVNLTYRSAISNLFTLLARYHTLMNSFISPVWYTLDYKQLTLHTLLSHTHTCTHTCLTYLPYILSTHLTWHSLTYLLTTCFIYQVFPYLYTFTWHSFTQCTCRSLNISNVFIFACTYFVYYSALDLPCSYVLSRHFHHQTKRTWLALTPFAKLTRCSILRI